MAVQYNPGIVTGGLVLCLDAANRKSYPGTGTAWSDLTGNSNNGTLINGPVYNLLNLGSIDFDGTNDYATIEKNAVLNIISQITLEAWIYPTKGSGVQNVICKSSSSENNAYIYPRTDNGWSQSVFYLHTGSWDTLSATWPKLNVWTYTAATYDGVSMNIYINGTLSSSKPKAGTITVNTNALAIADQPGYSEYYGGRIGQIKVYNRSLSAQEISQNFNALRGRFGI